MRKTTGRRCGRAKRSPIRKAPSCSRGFDWRREAPPLPGADGTHVDVDKTGFRIKTDTASLEREGCVMKFRQRAVSERDVDRHSLYMVAVASHTVAKRRQLRIRRRRAIT